MMVAACRIDRPRWTRQAVRVTSVLSRFSRLPFSLILAISSLTGGVTMTVLRSRKAFALKY